MKIIELLLKLPKKPVLEIITTIEEEIELIAVDDKSLISGKTSISDSSKRSTFILSGRYLIAIFLFYVINVVKVYFVVNNTNVTVIIPSIYDVGFCSFIFWLI